MGKTELPKYDIAVVGAPGVGKYSLSQQYAKGWIEPKETNKSETANCPTKVVQIQNRKIEVKVKVIKDLENNELQGCYGVVLVFSISDKSSFTYAKTTAYKKLHETFVPKAQNNEVKSDQKNGETNQVSQEIAETPLGAPAVTALSIPMILVGNKLDDAKLSKEVESDDAKALSQDLSCLGYFETAAPCNMNVPKAFECLITEIINNHVPETTTKEKKKTSAKACCVIV